MGDMLESAVDLGDGQQLAYKRWGEEGKPPLIALHGWQDNAASFDFLAPLLPRFCIYALDLAGHGLSYHRSRDGAYNIWQDIKDILQFTSALGIDRFTLMGHSRGAIISSLLSASFPERISCQVLLDGYLPEPVLATDSPQLLSRAIRDHLALANAQYRIYPTLEEALSIRQKGGLHVTAEAASALGTRGVSKTEKGYFWHADLRLRGASEFKLTQDHCRAFARAIACETLLLTATDSRAIDENRLSELSPLVHHQEIRGGHHFHMEKDGRHEAAKKISVFLSG